MRLPIHIEIVGLENPPGEQGGKGSLQKQETRRGSIRLIVSLPHFVDAEQANLAAALLFEQIDQLPSDAVVERVKVAGLRFTPDGVNGIKELLSVHASTVKHVSLKDILKDNASPKDERAFSALAQAFQHSELEVLNLSDNTIGAYMWKNWANQTGLHQLLLDRVNMDDASIKELACQLTCGETLDDIYVVLTRPVGAIAVEDACVILENCKNLTSMRWVNESANTESKLPLFGLRQMINGQLKRRGVTSLQHLVMDGAMVTVSELGNDGLYGALKELKQLCTLKLRDTGLRDGGVRSVVGALQMSQPPLEWLDMSGNQIQAGGAKAIEKLINVAAIISNMKVLVLECNEIDTEGGSHIIEAFASKTCTGFDVRLEGNPMDFSKIAMEMARAKVHAEKERDELRKKKQRANVQSTELKQNLRSLVSGQSSMVAEMKQIESEIESLKREKDVLSRAFLIAGPSSHINEQKRMLERVSKLEEMVQKSLPALAASGDEIMATPTRTVRGRRFSLGPLTKSDFRNELQNSIATSTDVSTPSNSNSRLSSASSLSADRVHILRQKVALERSNSMRIKRSPGYGYKMGHRETSNGRNFFFGSPEIPSAINFNGQFRAVHHAFGKQVRISSSMDSDPVLPQLITSPMGYQHRRSSTGMMRASSDQWGTRAASSMRTKQSVEMNGTLENAQHFM